VPSSRPEQRHLIYENPRLYDLAFSFRDIARECDGVLDIAREHGIARARSVVEIACGPGHHLREFARRGLDSIGVDISPDMLGYAKSLCKDDGVTARLQRADMRRFRLPRRVDLALCLFDSFTHCTSDADGIDALRATARALRPGGLMILELTHPADYFDEGHSRTLGKWVERHSDVVVRARYDTSGRDAVDETYTATMTIDATYRDGRAPKRIVSRQLHRMWLRGSISNIVARGGDFDTVGWYGDLSTRVPLSMSLDAWRMVVVLRRRATR
jgi:SAM-dependent methyltransferase